MINRRAFARRKQMKNAHLRPLPLRPAALGLAFICLLGGLLQFALAQNTGIIDPAQMPDWAIDAIGDAHRLILCNTVNGRVPCGLLEHGSQTTPATIPKFEVDDDASGRIATFQPGGSTGTGNAFFQNLGINGRTCFTCHQPQDGWTISAASVSARFEASSGDDPLFRLVDGATCKTDDISDLPAKRQAYKLLIDRGLIRVAIPLPKTNLQFTVTQVDDPYGCTTLTSPSTGILSMYRRPLPATNLGFLTTFMWDGREPSLASQSVDATLIHAEAQRAPSAEQQAEIVAFETGIFTAQIFDTKAHELHSARATGGPDALSQQLAKFFVGVNDPLGLNPKGLPFDPNIFNLYKPWLGLQGWDDETQYRISVARGEEVFNTTKINITGVAGLPDTVGFCGTCHDTPNVGNHSVKAPLNIGVANAGGASPPGLNISGLPVFTLDCGSQTFFVTDPGRALITGNCADIGKVKGPILRGLAARAPYFHNGSAATLMDAVNFYNQRFGIGFTEQQKTDLVNFLNTL
jgi:cytochrome c peroxidase